MAMAENESDDKEFSSFLSYLSTNSLQPSPPGENNAPADEGNGATHDNDSVASSSSLSSETAPEPRPEAQPQRNADPPKRGGCEAVGDKVDESISGFFYRIGNFCSFRPWTTIVVSLVIAVACSLGFAKVNNESRPEKLWVPQNTQAEAEQSMFLSYFPPSSRFQNVIATSNEGGDVLTMERLEDAMKMHEAIENAESIHEGVAYKLQDLCTPGGGTCADPSSGPVCSCLLFSVLKMWNYDLVTLQADTDILGTLNEYGSREDLEKVLGSPKFDPDTNKLVSAEAISVSYFLRNRSEDKDGVASDPINEAWEENVFLKTVQDSEEFQTLNLAYFSARSFNDEFGGEISGDVIFVNVSYLVAFIFLGATLGSKLCGRGSRWAMSMSTLILVALATLAGFGVASLAGLLFGPVHAVLPFVLLGIGVDDAFVIANAFDREREGVPRESEDDESLVKRGARSLARAGASITVTSLTDLVAFAISSTSALPALASFCAFAAINIAFLWALAATFFTATMVIDEKRQRANKRDILCCLARPENPDEADTGAKEGRIPNYFRRYHAPTILSPLGKAATLTFFLALICFGFYGLINLPVEDSARNFIPEDSYINKYVTTADGYFPSSGTALFITFEDGQSIYENRKRLAALDTQVSGLHERPPYIAEPNSELTYQNVMTGLKNYLDTIGTADIGGVQLGEDGWPINYEDFLKTLSSFATWIGPGSKYASDIAYDESRNLEAIRVQLEYVRLTKEFRGQTIEDASRQIDSMDATREMIESWTELQPAFPFSEKFIAIESFKIIGTELYRNVGLAIACVGVIVLFTVANVVTAFLITLNVAFCIIEILGFMYALGIVIDSVSVINVVLAVGLSIDYSAHVGHCFMVKCGESRDARATEALADIGSSVLNGALSTFLAVAVLLFSKSYVFKTLSTQFALTVGLGVLHGLVFLPVLLSMFGPKPFASAEQPRNVESIGVKEQEINAPTERAEKVASFGNECKLHE